MASPVKGVKNQIITLWEALTPPTEATILYRNIEDARQLFGGAEHRRFWFELPDGDLIDDFGNTNESIRSTFLGRVRLEVSGRGIDSVFDIIADEAVLLRETVNRVSSWPPGVDFVECTLTRPVKTDLNHIDLTFTINVITQEL